MKIHFIAIGGAAMHNLAIALHKKGYTITGSDDQVFEPSRSRLAKYNILPEEEGWDFSRITSDLDAVILGMHARIDNPELIEAQKKGVKIFSFPEYLNEQTKHKKQIVIGGSHGKTTITSMIMHVLKQQTMLFDYMVGSIIDGFDAMVGLKEKSKIAVFEGDEYLSSPIDLRSKFHHFTPTIGVISGIDWDHINVFPTFENYVKQFEQFIQKIKPGGILAYDETDIEVTKLIKNSRDDIQYIPYGIHDHKIERGVTFLINNHELIPIEVFGEHNMKNVSCAKIICQSLGLSKSEFYDGISTFHGAAKRLELLYNDDNNIIFRDFAHAPSKLRATVNAVRSQYPERKLYACMELHTFSSLNKKFLHHYESTMDQADYPIVFFNPETIKHKKLPDISKDDIIKAFANNNMDVYSDSDRFVKFMQNTVFENSVILFMSSGNFGGINFENLIKSLF